MASVRKADSLVGARGVLMALSERNGALVFRGQRDARWRAQTTLERAARHDKQADVLAVWGRFVSWANTRIELSGLDESQLLAIAQHYGLPTPLMDWTRSIDIALYFACEGGMPGSTAAVLHLDPNEWQDFWARHPAPPRADSGFTAVPPDMLELEVNGLWRLERQCGLFLESQVAEIERLFDFDRVTFPLDEDSLVFASEQRELVYPRERSALEEALNAFFEREQQIAIEASPQFAGLLSVTSTLRVEAHGPKFFGHASAWDSVPIEWRSGRSDNEVIGLPQRFDCVSALRLGIPSFLIGLDRTRPIATSCGVPSCKQGKFEATVALVWNGMRLFPYKIEDICIAVVASIEREASSPSAGINSRNMYKETEKRAFPSVLEAVRRAQGVSVAMAWHDEADMRMVEFGRRNELSQRAWCSSRALKWAFDRVGHDESTSLEQALCSSAPPAAFLEFEAMRQLWVHWIIPCQVTYRRGYGRGPSGRPGDITGNSPIYYSPATVEYFGLA